MQRAAASQTRLNEFMLQNRRSCTVTEPREMKRRDHVQKRFCLGLSGFRRPGFARREFATVARPVDRWLFSARPVAVSPPLPTCLLVSTILPKGSILIDDTDLARMAVGRTTPADHYVPQDVFSATRLPTTSSFGPTGNEDPIETRRQKNCRTQRCRGRKHPGASTGSKPCSANAASPCQAVKATGLHRPCDHS